MHMERSVSITSPATDIITVMGVLEGLPCGHSIGPITVMSGELAVIDRTWDRVVVMMADDGEAWVLGTAAREILNP